MRQTGSALIFGVAAVSLIVLITTPVVAFYIDTSAQLTLQAQAMQIATQTAQVVDEYKYWLEAPRPGFDQEVAVKTATDAAIAMSEKMGLQDAEVTISFEPDTEGNQLTTCRFKADGSQKIPIRANVLGFDMKSLFPGKVHVKGVTVHSAAHPYALLHMDAPTIADESTRRPLGFNQRDVAAIPAFGFFYNPTGQAGNTNTTAYGKGLAQAHPENFFAMNHYHLKKSDLDYVTNTSNDIANNGWNPVRVIDGRQVTLK